MGDGGLSEKLLLLAPQVGGGLWKQAPCQGRAAGCPWSLLRLQFSALPGVALPGGWSALKASCQKAMDCTGGHLKTCLLDASVW